MKKTIVVLLALLLVASLLPAAMAREDSRAERLKSISGASPSSKVLTSSTKLGKQAAERQRVADFRKAQVEKANVVPQSVVSEKPKITEVNAPVGSQERRKQLIEVQKERIKAARERRLASQGAPTKY